MMACGMCRGWPCCCKAYGPQLLLDVWIDDLIGIYPNYNLLPLVTDGVMTWSNATITEDLGVSGANLQAGWQMILRDTPDPRYPSTSYSWWFSFKCVGFINVGLSWQLQFVQIRVYGTSIVLVGQGRITYPSSSLIVYGEGDRYNVVPFDRTRDCPKPLDLTLSDYVYLHFGGQIDPFGFVRVRVREIVP